jgi:hypothetical protein
MRVLGIEPFDLGAHGCERAMRIRLGARFQM